MILRMSPWKSEEGDNLVPVAPPGLADRGVSLVPASLELGKPGLGGVGGLGAIDVLEVGGDDPAILVRTEVQQVEHQMDDAGLNDGVGEDRDDRLGEALQPIDDGDQGCLPRRGS